MGQGGGGHESHIYYGGSRKQAARFRYSGKSTSGFAELAPAHTPKAQDIFHWLAACESVAHVEWQTSKAAQGNGGNHYCDQSIKVHPKAENAGSAMQEYLEFQIT